MKLQRHYFQANPWELEGSWWLTLGPIGISLYLLAGRWVSLGVHLSIVPLYLDIHCLWFVTSIMSRKRAREFYADEAAYLAEILERIAASQ